MFEIDFNAIRKEHEAWRSEAKNTLIPGIDPADLRPGMKVTISPNLRQGDRSYTTEIHTIVALNSCHVQTRTSSAYRKEPIILLLHEHHFYAADDFEAPALIIDVPA